MGIFDTLFLEMIRGDPAPLSLIMVFLKIS